MGRPVVLAMHTAVSMAFNSLLAINLVSDSHWGRRASSFALARPASDNRQWAGLLCGSTTTGEWRTKLKPRWDVHLSGDDDQLG